VANINEAFPSKFLKASDLQGRTVGVVIERVDFEPVGQSREMKPILYFADKEKGLVLNKTNANKIIQIAGSTETEDWHGIRVAIYPTETSFQGDQVECIRIKAAPPVSSGREARRPAPPVEADDDAITDESIPF
jgi:hypothetical protein